MTPKVNSLGQWRLVPKESEQAVSTQRPHPAICHIKYAFIYLFFPYSSYGEKQNHQEHCHPVSAEDSISVAQCYVPGNETSQSFWSTSLKCYLSQKEKLRFIIAR